jgi:hypothetical protein
MYDYKCTVFVTFQDNKFLYLKKRSVTFPKKTTINTKYIGRFEMYSGITTICDRKSVGHVIFFLWAYVKDRVFFPPLPREPS